MKTANFHLANGKTSQSLGRAILNIQLRNETIQTSVPIIANLNYDFVMGTDLIQLFRLEQDKCLHIYHRGKCLTEDKAVVNTMKTDEMINKYKDIFVGIGRTNQITHDIKLKANKVVRHQVQQIPVHWHQHINQHLSELLDLNIIEYSNSEYRSRLVPKKKKDGSLRLAIDYRDLNNITKFDAFPMPNLRAIVAKLGTAKTFSKLDLTKGYYQIPLSPASKKFTAFAFDGKLYQFKVLPFGLASAPQTFQRLMEALLGHLPFVECYLDDVIIFSKNDEEHDKHLAEVLKIIDSENIKLNKEKCLFSVKKVDFLGLHISDGARGIINHNKLKLINFPTPKSTSDITAFVGCAGYYRDILPNFATMAQPLYACANSKKFVWSEVENNSFTTIKQLISADHRIHFPRGDLPFFVTTDASEVGMGGTLSQIINGHKVPVDFYSSKWNSAQKNYATIEKEATAITTALKHWRCYLLGAPFTIETDHRPLQWLLSKKDVTGKLGRMALMLQEYPIKDITYIKGTDNTIADALSRTQLEMLSLNNIEEDTRTLENEIAKNPSKFITINNKWFFRDDTPLGPRLRLCITNSSDRVKIVTTTHEAGHFGLYKCQEFIRNRFWWPHWQKDIAAFVKRCTRCAQFKSDDEKTRLPMNTSTLPSRYWSRIGVDLAGKWKTTPRGNSYILTVQDYYSKFLIARPLKNTKTTTIIAELKTIFDTHGTPETMMADCGPQFESREFKEFAESTNIKVEFASIGHHQSNGLVERAIRTIETMLRPTMDKQDDWDLTLPRVLDAYNSTPHHSTTMSPHLLAFGVEATTPLDRSFGISPATVDRDTLHRNFITNSREHHRQQKVQYDKRSKEETMKIGDLVLWHVPAQDLGSSKKLNRKWRGPFKIIKLSGTNANISDNKRTTRWIHRNHLKIFPGPSSTPLERIRNRGRPRNDDRPSSRPEGGV